MARVGWWKCRAQRSDTVAIAAVASTSEVSGYNNDSSFSVPS